MAPIAQTALLELVEAYLQDLRQEAETLSTIARLLNQSIESRRAIMQELQVYFASSAPDGQGRIPGNHVAQQAQAQPQAPDQWHAGPPPLNGAARANALVRDLDSLMAQPTGQQRAWPNGYHA